MTPLTMRFSPLRHEGTLVLERQGTALIVNGARHDLAALAARDDDTPATDWVQAVRVTDAGLEATVLLPHGPEAPEAVRFPQPVVVETDGPVAVPGASAGSGVARMKLPVEVSRRERAEPRPKRRRRKTG